ncbi:MAG: O-antigen ligase domain-containing protein [Anaerolineae bacterium]|nr:MAG: O-antigen ligase domain-containing protein [Anaerolineae bacterium]
MLTKSRGAWMGTALALGLLLVLRWRWWGVGAALAGSGAAAWAVQTTVGWQSIWNALNSSGAVSGLEGRMDIWSRAVYMMQDFPFTGVGMGTFGPVADLLYPFFLQGPGKIVHAHNLFLQMGVGWRLYRSAPDSLGRAVGVGVLLAQIALGVHGIFDAVVWGLIRAAPLLWLVWALGALAANLYLQPQQEGAA